MNRERLASEVLSRWYEPLAMYVTTYRPTFGESGKVSGGVGRYIADPALHGAFNEPSYMDTVKHLGDVTTATILTITAAHMQGHPWAFPGHKIVRVMEESVQENYCRQAGSARLQLISYQAVSFRQRIACGDTIELTSIIARSDEEGRVEADVEAAVGEKTAAMIKEARFRKALRGPDENTILADQLIEGAAQTVIALAYEPAENADPLFMGTGKANFSDFPKTGEAVLYHVSNLRRRALMFAADVMIAIEEAEGKREIGNIVRLAGLVMPKKEI